MQILSIFLKLQAVKQSGPAFLAYPVYIVRRGRLCKIFLPSSLSTVQNLFAVYAYAGGPPKLGVMGSRSLGIGIMHDLVEAPLSRMYYRTEFGHPRSNRMDEGRFNGKIHNAHAGYHTTRM